MSSSISFPVSVRILPIQARASAERDPFKNSKNREEDGSGASTRRGGEGEEGGLACCGALNQHDGPFCDVFCFRSSRPNNVSLWRCFAPSDGGGSAVGRESLMKAASPSMQRAGLGKCVCCSWERECATPAAAAERWRLALSGDRAIVRRKQAYRGGSCGAYWW